MAIHEISLGNFKAFRGSHRVPIKPITLIFGPNSSGKSSIIQALMLLKGMAQTKQLRVGKVDAGEEELGLPEFEHYVHRQNNDGAVALGFDCEIEEKDVPPVLADVTNGRTVFKVSSKFAYFQTFTSHATWPDDLAIAGLGIEVEDLISFTFINSLDDESGPSYKLNHINGSPPPWDYDYKLFEQGKVFEASRWPPPLAGSSYKYIQVFDSGVDNPTKPLRSSSPPVTLKLSLVDFAIGLATKSLLEMLDTRFLPALRAFPCRETRFVSFGDQGEESMQPLAGNLSPWERIINDDSLLDRLNELLGPNGVPGLKTPYELVKVPDPSMADIRETYLPKTAEKGPTVMIGEQTFDFGGEIRRKENIRLVSRPGCERVRLLLFDLKTAALLGPEDVGSGLGQIIPVLVEALGSFGGVHAISQPELHLHPALQADLMDVFISSASHTGQQHLAALLHLTDFMASNPDEAARLVEKERERQRQLVQGSLPWDGPKFILETHSEAMILRLMRRMRETAEGRLPEGMPGVKPHNVAILYVEPHEHGSVVHELDLAEDGSLLDPWPGGFFSDAFEDRFA